MSNSMNSPSPDDDDTGGSAASVADLPAKYTFEPLPRGHQVRGAERSALRAQVNTARRDGMAINEIARQLHRTPAFVYSIGPELYQQQVPLPPDADTDLFLVWMDLYQREGFTIDEIAEHTEWERTTVANALRTRIRMRPRGHRRTRRTGGTP
jgi:hypothetical protein